MAKKTVKKTAEKKQEKITKNMSIGEAVAKYPETAEIFMKHGMHCLGCAIAHFENIEQGAQAHGINVKKLIEDLNKAVKKKK
jgi:hybrid cluster-associated redox disulfide protein